MVPRNRTTTDDSNKYTLMSQDEKKKNPEDVNDPSVAALWQIPYECDQCKGTVALTNQTTECHLCEAPVDGAEVMQRFWAVLHDEKAWKEWQANQHALYSKADTQTNA
jgi:hypothetical protein